jgi:hypothetical protein
MSWDSSVGIATGYGLGNRGVGVRVPLESTNFSSPRRPDQLWGPPSLISNGYRGLYPRGQSARGIKLTTHLQLPTGSPPQSRGVAYCRQPASTVILGIEPRWDPWPYIFSVSRLLFFFSFVVPPLIKREGLGFFYNWCSLTTTYSTQGHIKVGDIYILYIFKQHKLTLSSTTHRDICQCRIVQQLMPQLI